MSSLVQFNECLLKALDLLDARADGGSGVSGIANGDGCHSSSSSVGAPDGAGCGDLKPTGEGQQRRARDE